MSEQEQLIKNITKLPGICVMCWHNNLGSECFLTLSSVEHNGMFIRIMNNKLSMCSTARGPLSLVALQQACGLNFDYYSCKLLL